MSVLPGCSTGIHACVGLLLFTAPGPDSARFSARRDFLNQSQLLRLPFVVVSGAVLLVRTAAHDQQVAVQAKRERIQLLDSPALIRVPVRESEAQRFEGKRVDNSGPGVNDQRRYTGGAATPRDDREMT